MKFKDTAALIAHIARTVDQALEHDVFSAVREAEHKAIEETVYTTPTDGYYRRRGEYGGLGDPYNIVIAEPVSCGRLRVINVTEPNPYLNGMNETGGRATTQKDLPRLVEYGMSDAGDPGYDYWKHPKARPFTKSAIDAMKRQGTVKRALMRGLERKGVKSRS